VTRLQKFLPWLRKSLWGICDDILFAKKPSASGAQHIIPKNSCSERSAAFIVAENRSLTSSKSPLRFRISCSGIHLPMDREFPSLQSSANGSTENQQIARFSFFSRLSWKRLMKIGSFSYFFISWTFVPALHRYLFISFFMCLSNRVVLFMHLIIHWSLPILLYSHGFFIFIIRNIQEL